MDPFQQIYQDAWLQGATYGVFSALAFFFMFQLKHLVMDFLIQNRFPYMRKSKGLLFHPGGWLHAGSHGVASFGILALLFNGLDSLSDALILCGCEVCIHFLIDYCKALINQRRRWKCDASPHYWDMLGLGQFLHQLTYIWLATMWMLQGAW